MNKTDIERLFHLLLGEQLLKETEVTNRMGFCNSYLSVSEGPAANQKLKAFERKPLILSISQAVKRAPKATKSTKVPSKSKVVPLHRFKSASL